MSHLDEQNQTSLTLSGKPIKWSWLVDRQRKIYVCHQNVCLVFSRIQDWPHTRHVKGTNSVTHPHFYLAALTDSCVSNISCSKNHWRGNKSWPRFLLFKADINHVFLCETITATPALRLWFLTSKWRTMPKGIWIGRCFLTLITPALHDHVKHKHIPHLCCTTWTESYDIGQESLDARLGPARRRLHLRVTS